jgi:hypothetical protein
MFEATHTHRFHHLNTDQSVIGCYTEPRAFGEPTKGSLGKAT